MVLLKCSTQYASKFGRLRSGHRTGKGQFSFQSQRKAMPKNAQNYRTVALISHASKVMLKSTADSDCSHEILKTLAPWKKDYYKSKPHIKKQRYHFANKGPYGQSYGFLSSHYGCESWTIKKVEHQRMDAFEMFCWRRLLRIPWTAR